jgi:hypothetical protein
VLAGGAFEPGQVTSHGQPQLIRERHKTIGRDGGQFREIRHEPTLRLPRIITKLTEAHTTGGMSGRRIAAEGNSTLILVGRLCD